MKKLFFISVLSTFFLFSCKKEKMFVDYESNENLKLQTLDSKKTYIFNLTESQLKEIDERALIDAKAKYKGLI